MTRTFERFAGACAIVVGIGGLAYGLLFGAIVYEPARGLFITWRTVGLIGALVATVVSVALYYRLRETDRGFALLALLLGLAASLGQLENSGVGLSHDLTPGLGGAAADPAGALRFGVNGVALYIVGWLVLRGGAFPRALGWVAVLGGILLVLTYVGRLTGAIDPATKISTLPPVVYGIVIHPVFYVWLGVELRRGPQAA